MPASEAISIGNARVQPGPAEVTSQDVEMRWITHVLALINALLADRSRLALDNVALRQQVPHQTMRFRSDPTHAMEH